MGYIIQKQQLFLLFFISSFLVFPSVSTDLAFPLVPVINDINTDVTLSDFFNFQLHQNAGDIACLNSKQELQFSYGEGGYLKDILYYEFNSLEGVSNFDINVSFNYSFEGTVLGALLFRLGSNYAESGEPWEFTPVFNTEINDSLSFIGTSSIRDVWVGSSGTYRVVGHPDDIKDLYETSEPLFNNSGSVIVRFTRTEGNYSSIISLASGSEIISHYWDSGISKPLNFIAIEYYLDPDYTTKTEITLSNFSGFFQSNTAENMTLSDFTGFYPVFDNLQIQEQINGTDISFLYDNNQLRTGNIETTFLYHIPTLADTANFDLNVRIDYTFEGTVMGALLFRLGSNYAESGELWEFTPVFNTEINDSYSFIGTSSIRDVWVGSSGTYRVVGHPDDFKDEYETSNPPFNNSGSVALRFTRTEGNYSSTITLTSGTEIISHYWESGISKPLNFIAINYYLDPAYVTFTKVTLKEFSARLGLQSSTTTTTTTTTTITGNSSAVDTSDSTTEPTLPELTPSMTILISSIGLYFLVLRSKKKNKS